MSTTYRSSGAPVLLIPDVLDAPQCSALIAAHDAENAESGMLREVDGRMALVPDPHAKIRTDHTLANGPLAEAVTERLGRRVLPKIAEAFAYQVTRLERMKVVAYAGDRKGHFAPHRDNTTPDAAHRRFALTLNLNDGYEGGGLRFPEYGGETVAPPPGGAVVFSCSLLHEVLPVLSGRRLALLTFFYGDAEARRRAAWEAQATASGILKPGA